VYKDMAPLHKTETIPTAAQAGNEWELVCNECSFRARYTQDLAHGENRLEILNPGDPQARHCGNHGGATINPGQAIGSHQRHHTEEAWLTPEIRQKLSEILQGLD
jgi:hypothetical protein